MIISNVDNSTFNSNYGSSLGLTTSYQDVTISGVNAIGVYNYVDETLNDNLSSWSEPDFYSKYFNGKKLTLMNTTHNDGVLTVKNIDLFDKIYYKYELTQRTLHIFELLCQTLFNNIFSGFHYLSCLFTLSGLWFKELKLTIICINFTW